MSEETKRLVKETVENLQHLDEESLRLMKTGSELLRARDALDKVKPGKASQKELQPV